jgi:prepilin-type N-terminal cleavage/methylation domain-containing protein
MKILLQFIIKLKSQKYNVKNSGFTLIELLVALVLAVLIITPLMGFMIDILDNDRREQAKTTTGQEVQSAIDFIQRDLQQAIYIYDNDALITRRSTIAPPGDGTIPPSGIQDQIPPKKPADVCKDSTCQPVLVFWKREFLSNSVGVSSATDVNKDDGFAYSLVGYYLISNTGTTPNTTWSRSARIARFQIRGKVSSANRTTDKGGKRSKGYNPPPLDLTIPGAKLKDKMNRWAAQEEDYDDTSNTEADQVKVLTLVDYVSNTGPAISCPAGSQQTGSVGFYACVEADSVIAQVSVTGNAFKRLNKDNSYSDNNSAYFPTSTIRVQGRGFLFVK